MKRLGGGSGGISKGGTWGNGNAFAGKTKKECLGNGAGTISRGEIGAGAACRVRRGTARGEIFAVSGKEGKLGGMFVSLGAGSGEARVGEKWGKCREEGVGEPGNGFCSKNLASKHYFFKNMNLFKFCFEEICSKINFFVSIFKKIFSFFFNSRNFSN